MRHFSYNTILEAWSHGAKKVSHDARKVSHDARKVSMGARKVSHVVRVGAR